MTDSLAANADPGRRWRLGCCLELSDALVTHYLTPLARASSVERIHVVRSRPLGRELPSVSVDLVPRHPRWRRFAAMYRRCRELAVRADVDAFVSFNPNPYGLIAGLAARNRVPYHLGFIGSDWFLQSRRALGRLTRPLVRRATLVTATGPGMRDQLIAWGVRKERIRVLPHAVDLSRFPVADPERASFDFVYVGQLIPRKRVSEILHALALVANAHPGTRLLVVGDGSERSRLEALSEHLGLATRVRFAGPQNDVWPFLADARIAVMASEVEGFPFALVEAMASGLVPVSTRAGSIAEVLESGKTGLLVDVGDREALAGAMAVLLDEPRRYERLRSKVLEGRSRWGYERATRVWEQILREWTERGVPRTE